MNHAFGVIFQKTLPNSSSNVFLLKVFQFIAYNIFVIHFELIFIYWSKFDFLLMESILQYQLLKMHSFSTELSFTFAKIQLTMHSWVFILGPLFFSINLFAYHNATVSWVLFSMTVMSWTTCQLTNLFSLYQVPIHDPISYSWPLEGVALQSTKQGC